MKRFSEQLFEKAQTVKLKAAERNELRERLVSYMEYHPLPLGGKRALSSEERRLFTESFRTVSVSGWRLVQWTGVAVCVLVVSASWRAEQAVPGEALYAMKVRFNEEVRSTLSFTPYQKITWEAERLNRRIAEARLLASEGKLTEAVEAEVVLAVRTHGDNARRGIEELQVTDSEEAAIAAMHLATTLEVQSVALQPVSTELSLMSAVAADVNSGTAEPVPQAPTDFLAAVLAEERSETAAVLSTELPSYDRLLAHVETDTTRARELLSTIKDAASPEERDDITRRLEDVDRVLARAFEVKDSDPEAARPLLVDALQRTQKLIVFMTNIDIRAAVPVEVLVPVEHTPEEQVVAINDVLSAVRTAVALIETTLSLETVSAEIHEKAAFALVLITDLATSTEAALSAGDIMGAERQGNEAQALANDTLQLLGILDRQLDPQTIIPSDPAVTATTSDVVGEVNGVATSTEASVDEVGEENSLPTTTEDGV
jgi:hypothetical protein